MTPNEGQIAESTTNTDSLTQSQHQGVRQRYLLDDATLQAKVQGQSVEWECPRDDVKELRSRLDRSEK